MTKTRDKRKPTGDCFEAALKAVMDLPEDERDNYRVVHGYALGQGPIEGVRFSHAWVEAYKTYISDRGQAFVYEVAIDRSNGKDVELPKGWYYNLGAINPDEVVSYEVHEALLNSVRSGHFGPWDIARTEEELDYLEKHDHTR